MTVDPAVTEGRIARLLEITRLIRTPLAQRTAQKAERRKLEGTLERIKADTRNRLRESDPVYPTLKSDDREAYFLSQVYHDEAFQKAYTRLDQVLVALDKAVAEIEELDHERKALKAALEGYAAAVAERLALEQKAVDAARRAAQGGHHA